MPVWEISAPDGSTYEIEGDSEPTQDELDRMFPAPPITQIAEFPVRKPGITLAEDLAMPTPVFPWDMKAEPESKEILPTNLPPLEPTFEKPMAITKEGPVFRQSGAPQLSIYEEPTFATKAMSYPGNVLRAIPADIAETVSGNEPYYELHNLAAAALGEPLPIDEALRDASSESKTWATVGKISQGLAGTAPMLAIGHLPEAAQQFALAAFTAQMIGDAPEIASQLGEELGKPKDQQDPDKITSLVSDAIQVTGFSPAAALGLYRGIRPTVPRPEFQMGSILRPPAERGVPISTGVPEVTAPEGVELPPPRPTPKPQEAIASELGITFRGQVKTPKRSLDQYVDENGVTVSVPSGSPIDVVRTRWEERKSAYEPADLTRKVGEPAAPEKAEAPTVTETTAPVPPEEMPTTPTVTGVRPAIRLVGGKVIAGDAGMTHPDIIKANELKATDIDQRGFVNERGEFMDREQTAVETGVPTEKEPARQHSTDLPEAKPAAAPAEAEKPDVAKMGTDDSIKNIFGDPHDTRYHATAEDWAEWQRLTNDFDAAMKAPKPDLEAAMRARAEKDSMKKRYGGMPPEAPKPAETAPAPITERPKKTPEVVAAEDATQSAFEKLGASEKGAYDKSKRKGMTKAQLKKLSEFDALVEAEKQAKTKARAERAAAPPAPVEPKGLAKNIRERLKAGEKPGAEAGGGVPIGDLIHEYGLKLYETVKDKAQWTAQMLRDLGAKARQWLEQVWNRITVPELSALPKTIPGDRVVSIERTEADGSKSRYIASYNPEKVYDLRDPRKTYTKEEADALKLPQIGKPSTDGWSHTMLDKKTERIIDDGGRSGALFQRQTPKATPLPLEVEAGAGINIPLPSLGSVLDTVRDLPEKTRTLWRAFSMQSLPRITRASRETGEAGVRYASSPSVARAKGLMFAERVTEGIRDRDFNQKFGVGLTEDNLRGIKQSFNEQAAAAATPEEAQALRDKANSVVSMVGAENSPFQTEAQYQAFMRSPEAQRAIRRHIRLWENEKDPIYRQARDLDPDVELETRGAQFGARINLKAVRPGEAVRTAVGPSTRSPLIRATATIRRTDPFGRAAKGTGTYDGSYSEIMANGFGREYPVAKQHDFIKKLIDSGQATVSNREFEPDLTIGGEATKGYPLRLNPWGGKFLQIRRSLAPEYEDVTGLHPAAELGLYTKAANVATRLSVTGLAEGSTHVSNLLTQAFTGMGPTANPFLNALVKSLGRADVLYSVPRILIKSFGDRRADILKLAEIGAAKDPYRGTVGWFITKIDQGTRLYASEVYKRMAAKGWVPDTETGLREYVNQVGQYNKRLQPRSIQLLRTTGIQPFATAMQTFNVQGLRTLAAAPGIKGSTKMAAVGLRAEKAANILGFIGVVTALNMLVSGTPSGPKGTRIGAVGWIDDKKKLRQFDLGTLTGITRGARITGLQPAIEARRLGLSKGASLMAGFRGAATTGLSAATGPLNRAAFMTVTGKRVGVPPTQEAKVMPPQREQDFTPLKTQLASNIAQAAQEASPLVDFAVRMKQGKGEEAVTRQFTRYTPKTGMAAETIEKLPKIVEKGQLNDYLDSVAKEAFKLSPGQREAYVRKRFREDELPSSMRTEAQTKLRRRGLFPKKI